VWGPEGRLQENDRINKISFKEVMKVHRLVTTDTIVCLNENM
jgi:SNF2 family DNA or RNA helicase